MNNIETACKAVLYGPKWIYVPLEVRLTMSLKVTNNTNTCFRSRTTVIRMHAHSIIYQTKNVCYYVSCNVRKHMSRRASGKEYSQIPASEISSTTAPLSAIALQIATVCALNNACNLNLQSILVIQHAKCNVPMFADNLRCTVLSIFTY
ncbi:unnamed protein product [Wuchereria bancrofti]|uniref:Uncharacterized protein n=1 Tax=Wuchereria bancrofti TaxID=6293 RepID=A0A3P7GE36_WUCBA|nr:unnamed protein product [Wuchereria bancrofti]